MRRRGYTSRSALAGMPHSGPSEAQVKIGWLQDRLRRTTAALSEIEARAKKAHAQCSDQDLRKALQELIDYAHQTLDAEAVDARR